MFEQRPVLEAPQRGSAAVNPWVEISAWILAFAVLLAAQCAPDRAITGPEGNPAGEARH